MIIGISGRKGSGKNTIANYILGTELWLIQFVRGEYTIDETTGKLWISDVFGDVGQQGILDINNPPSEDAREFLNDEVKPFVWQYSCADALKELCINILGLTWEQVNGTDEQKNSLTNLYWEDMPCKQCEIIHNTGKMTGREVMQHVGTGLFRRMIDTVWIDATIRKIKKEQSAIALITDVRFPDEVDKIHENGGVVVRLTRDPYNDQHESETALDPENFDWNKFNFIIDNKNMSIVDQSKEMYKIMAGMGIFPMQKIKEAFDEN